MSLRMGIGNSRTRVGIATMLCSRASFHSFSNRSPPRRTAQGDLRRIFVPGWRSRQHFGRPATHRKSLRGDFAGVIAMSFGVIFSRYDLRLLSISTVSSAAWRRYSSSPCVIALSSISSASSSAGTFDPGLRPPPFLLDLLLNFRQLRSTPHFGAPGPGFFVLPGGTGEGAAFSEIRKDELDSSTADDELADSHWSATGLGPRADRARD